MSNKILYKSNKIYYDYVFQVCTLIPNFTTCKILEKLLKISLEKRVFR